MYSHHLPSNWGSTNQMLDYIVVMWHVKVAYSIAMFKFTQSYLRMAYFSCTKENETMYLLEIIVNSYLFNDLLDKVCNHISIWKVTIPKYH